MIFKIHYGLWYGGLVGIIPFMFNYAQEYSGATATQHGILYTVLPFVALLAKPAACSVADKYAAHHKCLLAFIALTIVGYGSLAIYPFFSQWSSEHKDFIWIMYCMAALLGNTSMCVVNSIGDSLAINSCQRKGVCYGSYRLWGPVGFGVFGVIWGLANEIPSMPKYTPGILTMITILFLNSLLILFWHEQEEFKVVSIEPASESSQRAESAPGSALPAPNYSSTNQLVVDPLDRRANAGSNDLTPSKVNRVAMLMRLVRRDKTILVYMFMFTFCGIMTALHWQFFFAYLAQMAKDSNQNFSLITTIVLPVQALGGELIFFMLSGKILNWLGAPTTLSLCLFSFAARYLLYAYFVPHVNLYWVLPVELLQGPAFGLMYCVLTYQANVYSDKIDKMMECSSDANLKKSLHATLQGLLGAAFEGLGLGLGAIIGGRIYDVTPILMWQLAGYSALGMGLLYSAATVASSLLAARRETMNPSERPITMITTN